MVETIIDAFGIWTEAQGVKSKGRTKSIGNISLEGLARLREFILELAIRGKLVPQDPKDEPASVLLKKIKKEKEKLVKEGKIKKEKPLPEIKEEEKPFALPQGWEWVRLGSIANKIGSGSTPRGGADAYTETGIIFLRSQNIRNEGLQLDDVVYINDAINTKMAGTTVEPDDILLNITGGSLGRSTIFPNYAVKANVSQHVTIIRPTLKDSTIFLHKCILSPYIQNMIWGRQVGANREGLSKRILELFEFPLPPLAEQHRIVSKVNELMALCDKLEQGKTASLKTHQTLVNALLQTLTRAPDADELASAWQRLASHFDTLFCTEDSIEQLKQTILQLAVMGRLVKQNPNDEPASVLLKKIQKEKDKLVKEGKIKKEKQPPEVRNEEKPFELPEAWEWVRLSNIIDVRDGTHDSPEDAIGNNVYPLVTSKDFIEGKINFESARRISEKDHLEISKRSKVDKLDILFSMIGGNLGNQVIVTDEREFSIKNLALFKYYKKEYTLPFFIKRLTEHLAYSLQKNATGGAQPFVALGYLRRIVVALPPLAEQHRIVAKVNELMALCDRLKERLAKAQEIQNTLSHTLLESALT